MQVKTRCGRLLQRLYRMNVVWIAHPRDLLRIQLSARLVGTDSVRGATILLRLCRCNTPEDYAGAQEPDPRVETSSQVGPLKRREAPSERSRFGGPYSRKAESRKCRTKSPLGSVRASHRSLVALDPDVSGLTADTVKAAEFGNVDSSLGRLPTALPLEDELHAL